MNLVELERGLYAKVRREEGGLTRRRRAAQWKVQEEKRK